MDALDLTTRRRLERFAQLVADSPHNLVSRAAREELLTRHVPECVSLASLLPAGGGRLLDVGSGGGFPGMVLAIVRPEYEVHLLDATRKKTAFLEQAADELGVKSTIHTGRAEDLASSELARSFDVVTARAVAPIARLLPWTLPFLVEQGVLYAVKGERWRDELDAARDDLARWRGQVVATPDDVGPDVDSGTGTPLRVVMIARTR